MNGLDNLKRLATIIDIKEHIKNLRRRKQSGLPNCVSAKRLGLFQVSKVIIAKYFDFLGEKPARQVTHYSEDEYNFAQFRSKDEHFYVSEVKRFLAETQQKDPWLYNEYKDCLAKSHFYRFQSHPIAHLSYGIKTAISFYWKMAYVLKYEIPETEIIKLAKLTATLSLPQLMALDGVVWDSKRYQAPRMQWLNGRLVMSAIDLELEQLKFSGHLEDAQLGCPALAAKTSTGENPIDILGREILTAAKNYWQNRFT